MIQDELTRLVDEADEEDEEENAEDEKQPSVQGVEAWKHRTYQGKVAYIVSRLMSEYCSIMISNGCSLLIVFHLVVQLTG